MGKRNVKKRRKLRLKREIKEKGKAIFHRSVPFLMAGIVSLTSIQVFNAMVFAEEPEPWSDTISIHVNSAERNIEDTIKEEILKKEVDTYQININNVDISKTTIYGINEDDYRGNSLPSVKTVHMKVVEKVDNMEEIEGKENTEENGGEIWREFTIQEDIILTVDTPVEPQVNLKAKEITVAAKTERSESDWDIENPIISITDDSDDFLKIEMEDNVDVENDGTYYATYTATDANGNVTSEEIKVIVETPDWVIEEREEEERIRKEEEEKKKQEEEKRKKAEEQAKLESMNVSRNLDGYITSGSNPYSGGWSNCTWGAWMAAYNASGIKLPGWGNASEWYYRAPSSGYNTGRKAASNSIAVYSHHVAYVSKVSDDGTMAYIIEGGYLGGYNERWVSTAGLFTQSLQGYIYLP